nr:GCN5-like N-acetyltransferase [Cyanidioschyzonaceae sp. 3]
MILVLALVNDLYIYIMRLKQVKQIDLTQLEALYSQVGWSPRKLQQLMRQSWLCLALYQNHQLIGFARVVSDHTWNATIWDVVIHPAYQRKGLGKYLVYQMIRWIKQHNVIHISLFAESRAVTFYQRIGFEVVANAKAMFWC